MATTDEIYEVCVEIKEEIATINQRCKGERQKIEGHHRTLYGDNGTGGIVASVNALSRQSKDKKEWLYRIISAIVSPLIVAGILWALYLWKNH